MNSKFRKLMAALMAFAVTVTMLGSIAAPTVASSLEGNPEISRWAASEGMVLLENDNDVLPVPIGSTVALFGRATIDYTRGGGGSAATNVDYTTNILQGMQAYERQGKVTLVPELVEFYTQQVTTNGIKNDANITITDDVWNAASAATETAIVTIGRTSTEGADRDATKGDYYLSDAEVSLLTRVAAEFENTVVVLNVGAVMDTSWVNTIAGIDSVLLAWLGGMEGGNATADVLMGTVNPSGKTVDTWAKSYNDYPSSETFKETNLPAGEAEHSKYYNYVNYTEDIFVGYRYFETIPSAYDKVIYEFGYGLSYTDFTTTVDEVKVEGDNIVANVTVKNVGDRAGKEVVQLYFTAPDGVMTKPAKELAAFDKTDLLEPGESQTLTLSFPIFDMSSYDDIGQVQKSAYVMEAGAYKFFIGNSIRDGEYVEFEYTLDDTVVAEQLTELCEAIQLPKRMQADGTYKSAQYYFPVSSNSDTIIQSENFSSKNGSAIKMERFEYNTYLNGFCVGGINAIGDYIEYGFNAKKAGQYAIYFSYADGYGGKTDIFDVTVDGVIQPLDAFDTTATAASGSTSKWFNFSLSTNYMTINLKEGYNLVRFTAKKTLLANFDYMLIRPLGASSSGAVTVSATAKTRIEAENYASRTLGEQQSGMTVKTKDGVGTWVENMNLNNAALYGNTLTYNLDVEQAGRYRIVLRGTYSQTAIDNFPMFSKVVSSTYGERVYENVFSLPAQTDWYSFGDTNGDFVELPKGNCTFSICVRKGTLFPNIDSFTLEYVGSLTDPTVDVNSTDATVIQAEDYVSTGWLESGYPVYNETSTVDKSRTSVAHVSHVGNYLTYWLNVEDAGDYNITLTCSNGSPAYTFSPSITVNGVDQSVSFDIATTRIDSNPWHNYVNQKPFTVKLEKGFNVLKMECTTINQFPNIDYFTIAHVDATDATVPSYSHTKQNEKIMLVDVYKNPLLMDAFLEQMTNTEFVHLATAQIPDDRHSTTGGIGNLANYGIPLAMTSDGPQGLRFAKTNEKTTAWPSLTCLASSWNLELVEAMAKAFAKEAHFYDIDIILAPGLNIHRDPLCGRNFEYFSEDPLLSGKFGAAFTNGFQSEGVGVSVKHFAANNREQNRMNLDSRVSERALREIYLRAFEITVKESDPYTIMSSYNLINGVKAGENSDLLTGILRTEWGYEGLLFTDYGNNSRNVAELLAGNDLKMLNSKPAEINTALTDGVINREQLKTVAERVVNIVLRCNAFTDRYVDIPVVEIGSSTRLKAADNITNFYAKRVQKTNDVDGGYHLSHIDSSVYTEYEIDVKYSGSYKLNARIASAAGSGSFKMLIDGTQVASFNATNTGAYSNWTTVTSVGASAINLQKGRHTLRLTFDAAGFNLNWIEFINQGVVVNETTGKTYNVIDTALNESNRGDTLTLIKSTSTDLVTVRSVRTLDLNGYTLTANYVVGFNDSSIVDYSAAKTGKLVTAIDSTKLAKNNKQLPIYDAQNNCFVFTTVQTNVYGANRFKYAEDEYKYKTSPFLYQQGNEAEMLLAHRVLLENFDTTGVNIKIRVEWEDVEGTFKSDQDFIYLENQVKAYIESWGYNSKNQEKYDTLYARLGKAVLSQGKNVKLYTVIDSQTGVEVISSETLVNQ